jgi:hypothetical protein
MSSARQNGHNLESTARPLFVFLKKSFGKKLASQLLKGNHDELFTEKPESLLSSHHGPACHEPPASGPV